MGSRQASRVTVVCLAFILLASATNSVHAAKYDYNPDASTATVQTPTAPLQTGVAGTSTVSLGNYATVTVSSSSLTLYYVPVTLTNSQSQPTPSPLQVKVTWNPSTYASYEASSLGNIRFCSDVACNSPLYAWLESCTPSCSTGATSASAWVKLTSQIAGSGGTLTIYMAFLSTATPFDDNYWGEAPSLSGTYGQYDNGAQVFSIYFNGNTPTSSFTEDGSTLTQATGVTYGPTTISALELAVKATKSAMSFAPGVAPGGYIGEANLEINPLGGVTTDYVGLVDSATAANLANGVGGGEDGTKHFVYNYWSSGAHTIGTATSYTIVASTWYYADLIYPGASAASFTTDLYTSLYSTPLATSSASANPLTSIGTFYFGLPTGNGGATGTTLYYNWARVRVYPPNNVLPLASPGSTTRAAILTISNSGSSAWLANLVAYSSTNAARLSNLTLSFQSPYSEQVVLGTAVTNQNSGPQVTLAASATIAIIIGVTVNSGGTSTVTMGLKIQSPPAGVQASSYCYDTIALTVN